VPNCRSSGFIENLEFDAIESNKAFLCSNPEITISGLQQGLNTVLGQAIFRTPDRMNILRDGLVRIQTPGGVCKAYTETSEEQDAPHRCTSSDLGQPGRTEMA
jgi:hypothetical protein